MDKQRHTVFLSRRAWQSVEKNYLDDGCKTKNEFIERAIHFYSGYVSCNNADEYLPPVLSSYLNSFFELIRNKLGRLLFKYAVEQNIANHILAYDSDIDTQTYEKLRGRSINEVMQSHGEVSFKDAVKFQSSV